MCLEYGHPCYGCPVPDYKFREDPDWVACLQGGKIDYHLCKRMAEADPAKALQLGQEIREFNERLRNG